MRSSSRDEGRGTSRESARVRFYRDLLAWQKAMVLVESVYALVGHLPADERFGLASQLRRAAISIPSNIAEGHAREATKEFARYVAISRGSLAEVETQLELAVRLKMLSSEATTQILADCDELGRILRGLRKSLDLKLAPPHR